MKSISNPCLNALVINPGITYLSPFFLKLMLMEVALFYPWSMTDKTLIKPKSGLANN
jgi:hypothetical protein